MRSLKIVVYFFPFFFFVSCGTKESVPVDRQEGWAKKVEVNSLDNLYKVDEVLFRSEQPDVQAVQELQQMGIKTVLNLRRFKNDKKPANCPVSMVHVRINTWTISYNDVLTSLREIEKAEKPVLVHCKHGSDRTGAVVAAWCMVKHNCSKEQVIYELRKGGYHFHEKYFKNIIRLINSIDVEQLKKDMAKQPISHNGNAQ